MSEPEVFETDADGEVRALQSARRTEARVRRQTLNSGLVPVGWGPRLIGGGVMWRKANR